MPTSCDEPCELVYFVVCIGYSDFSGKAKQIAAVHLRPYRGFRESNAMALELYTDHYSIERALRRCSPHPDMHTIVNAFAFLPFEVRLFMDS